MTFTVFLAVLSSSFFQASWNFFAKNSKSNKIALLAIGWFAYGLIMIPVALMTTPMSFWSVNWLSYCLASALVHAFYVCLLGWAYMIGEISVIYPVARGLGIAGTTLLAISIGLHEVSMQGALGIGIIVLGTFLIGAQEFPHRDTRKAFLVAVLVAVTVSAYSIIDSEGAKNVPLTVYIMSMNILAPLIASPFLLWKLRREMKTVVRSHKSEALFVAVAGSVAYGIILWAYQRAPVSYVAALREFSVVIAVGLGIFFLKETVYIRKILGIISILVGVALLKLA